jgi:hypothetical protein
MIGHGLGARQIGYGLGASPGGAVAGVDWSQWFDHCWVAKDAADLAASCTNLVGATTLTTTSAPSLNSKGWDLDGVSQFLLAPLLPHDTWTLAVRFANGSAQVAKTICGCAGWDAYRNRYFYLWPNYGAGSMFCHGLNTDQAYGSVITDGVIVMAGPHLYVDGIWLADGADSTPFAIDVGQGIGIGAQARVGDIIEFWAGTITAFAVRTSTLSPTDVVSASAAMAAL